MLQIYTIMLEKAIFSDSFFKLEEIKLGFDRFSCEAGNPNRGFSGYLEEYSTSVRFVICRNV